MGARSATRVATEEAGARAGATPRTASRGGPTVLVVQAVAAAVRSGPGAPSATVALWGGAPLAPGRADGRAMASVSLVGRPALQAMAPRAGPPIRPEAPHAAAPALGPHRTPARPRAAPARGAGARRVINKPAVRTARRARGRPYPARRGLTARSGLRPRDRPARPGPRPVAITPAPTMAVAPPVAPRAVPRPDRRRSTWLIGPSHARARVGDANDRGRVRPITGPRGHARRVGERGAVRRGVCPAIIITPPPTSVANDNARKALPGAARWPRRRAWPLMPMLRWQHRASPPCLAVLLFGCRVGSAGVGAAWKAGGRITDVIDPIGVARRALTGRREAPAKPKISLGAGAPRVGPGGRSPRVIGARPPLTAVVVNARARPMAVTSRPRPQRPARVEGGAIPAERGALSARPPPRRSVTRVATPAKLKAAEPRATRRRARPKARNKTLRRRDTVAHGTDALPSTNRPPRVGTGRATGGPRGLGAPQPSAPRMTIRPRRAGPTRPRSPLVTTGPTHRVRYGLASWRTRLAGPRHAPNRRKAVARLVPLVKAKPEAFKTEALSNAVLGWRAHVSLLQRPLDWRRVALGLKRQRPAQVGRLARPYGGRQVYKV